MQFPISKHCQGHRRDLPQGKPPQQELEISREERNLQQEGTTFRPGEENLGNLPVIALGQKSPVANCGKENNCLHSCHPKLWEWHPCPVDTQNLDCIKVIAQKNNSGTPTTKTQGEERPVEQHRIHGMMITFCLICLSLSHSLTPFLFLSLSTSHLLLNKISTIDFSLWSHLHLDLDRGTI